MDEGECYEHCEHARRAMDGMEPQTNKPDKARRRNARIGRVPFRVRAWRLHARGLHRYSRDCTLRRRWHCRDKAKWYAVA